MEKEIVNRKEEGDREEGLDRTGEVEGKPFMV